MKKKISYNGFLTYCKERRGVEFKILAGAVIRQMGGWENWKQYAIDIYNHGISGGYGGFIYYSETVAFAVKNRKDIIALIMWEAESFSHIHKEFTDAYLFLIENTGLSSDDQEDKLAIHTYLATGISADKAHDRGFANTYNWFAWFAAECVAGVWANYLEEIEVL